MKGYLRSTLSLLLKREHSQAGEIRPLQNKSTDWTQGLPVISSVVLKFQDIVLVDWVI